MDIFGRVHARYRGGVGYQYYQQQTAPSLDLANLKHQIDQLVAKSQSDTFTAADLATLKSLVATVNDLSPEVDSLSSDTQDQLSDIVSSIATIEGKEGPVGPQGASGLTGETGATGAAGASGIASCPFGNCLSLQTTGSTVPETGSVEVDGDLIAGGTIQGTLLVGDGSSLTNLNASNVSSGTLPVSAVPSSIPATSLALGTVSNTEFGYLDGVTDALQDQLDAKLNIGSSGASTRVAYWSTADTLSAATGVLISTNNISIGSSAALNSARAINIATSLSPGSGTGAAGVRATVTRTSASSGAGLIPFYSDPTIDASGLTVDWVQHFYAENVSISAGTLNHQYGFYADSLTGATDNWGFYSNGGNNLFRGTLGVGLAAHTAASSALEVAGAITVSGTASNPASTIRYIGPAGTADNLTINVPSTGVHRISVGGNTIIQGATTSIILGRAGTDFGINIAAGASAGFNGTAGNVQLVANSASALNYNVPTAGTHRFNVQGSLVLDVGAGGVDSQTYFRLSGSTANPAGSVRYIGTGGSASNLNINVPTGGVHNFQINGANQVQIQSTGLNLGTANSFSVGIGMTATPARKIEVGDSSSPQLRLTHTAGSIYSELQTDSNGALNLTNSNTSAGALKIGAITGGSYPLQVAGVSGWAATLTGSVRINNDNTTQSVDLGGVASAVGERPANAGYVIGSSSGSSLIVAPGNSAGTLVVGSYWDGSQHRSALEWGSVSTPGTGVLALMKSGGTIRQFGTNLPTHDENAYTLSTSNATVTTIATLSTTTDQLVRFTAFVTGRCSGGAGGNAGKGAGYTVTATFRNIGGTLTQIGSTTVTGDEDAAVSGWDVTVTTSGTNILLQVTGAATDTVRWDATTTKHAGQ